MYKSFLNQNLAKTTADSLTTMLNSIPDALLVVSQNDA